MEAIVSSLLFLALVQHHIHLSIFYFCAVMTYILLPCSLSIFCHGIKRVHKGLTMPIKYAIHIQVSCHLQRMEVSKFNYTNMQRLKWDLFVKFISSFVCHFHKHALGFSMVSWWPYNAEVTMYYIPPWDWLQSCLQHLDSVFIVMELLWMQPLWSIYSMPMIFEGPFVEKPSLRVLRTPSTNNQKSL